MRRTRRSSCAASAVGIAGCDHDGQQHHDRPGAAVPARKDDVAAPQKRGCREDQEQGDQHRDTRLHGVSEEQGRRDLAVREADRPHHADPTCVLFEGGEHHDPQAQQRDGEQDDAHQDGEDGDQTVGQRGDQTQQAPVDGRTVGRESGQTVGLRESISCVVDQAEGEDVLHGEPFGKVVPIPFGHHEPLRVDQTRPHLGVADGVGDRERLHVTLHGDLDRVTAREVVGVGVVAGHGDFAVADVGRRAVGSEQEVESRALGDQQEVHHTVARGIRHPVHPKVLVVELERILHLVVVDDVLVRRGEGIQR